MTAASTATKTTNPFVGQNRTKKHRAAILLAEDELTGEAIAGELKIARSTLALWKVEPEFQQAVGNFRGALVAEALRLPIAKKHERVKQLNELNNIYWQIKEQRAERFRGEMTDTPDNAVAKMYGDFTPAEATTGMLIKQTKISASGKVVVDWTFDKALDSAIKETHKQAAQELGQWVEQSQVEMDGGMRIEIVGMADEDLP